MINPYAVMYDARMDIYRWEDVTVNNITIQEKRLVAEARPCRYSSSGQTQTETPAPAILNHHRLFCGIDEEICEGDRLVITMRTGKTVEVKVGECHPYTYQWQCEIERDEEA